MHQIPLFDLSIQEPELLEEIKESFNKIITGKHFILGPYTEQMETELTRFFNGSYSIGVNSGSTALHLALLAAGIKQGDEVITTPFTFIATSAAIRFAQAKPVFADIDPRSYNINPESIRKVITPKTKAIIVVHLFGQPAELEPILEIAKEFNLIVIEDVAQAFGAKYQGKLLGTVGDIGCFSFYPTKILGSIGDSGLIITKNNSYYEKIKSLRNIGKQSSIHYSLEGFNARISEIQAATILAKLKYIDKWIKIRQIIAQNYITALRNTALTLPIPTSNENEPVYALFTVAHPEREQIIHSLSQNGIETGIYYPLGLHQQKVYTDLNYHSGEFPITEKSAKEVFSLPIYPGLSKENQEIIIEKLIKSVLNTSEKN